MVEDERVKDSKALISADTIFLHAIYGNIS